MTRRPSAAGMASLQHVARELRSLRRQVSAQARASQAAHRSLDGGALTIYEPVTPSAVGEPPAPTATPRAAVRLGASFAGDGTFGLETFGGTPPSAPSAPLITPAPRGVTITWDGFNADAEQAWCAQLAYVSVRMSTDPYEAGVPVEEVARFAAAKGVDYGGAVNLTQPADTTTYVTFVAVLCSGVESPPSVEVAATGGLVERADLDTTAVDGMVITGSVFQTAFPADGERIVVRNDGSGGVIESFTGLADETHPAVFDPSIHDDGTPGVEIRSARSVTYDEPVAVRLYGGTAGGVAGVDPLGVIELDSGLSGFIYLHSKAIFVGTTPGDDKLILNGANGDLVMVGRLGIGGVSWQAGTGSPEGVVAAPVGSMFTRKDGGAGTTLYVKESGTGATGWVGK